MSYDDSRVLSWYGGAYYDPPPPPPPEPTTEGGNPPPTPDDWAKARSGNAVARPTRHAGDALVMGRFLPVHSGHARLLGEAMQAVNGKVLVAVAGWRDDFIDARERGQAAQFALQRERLGPLLVAREVGKRGEPDGDSFWAPWVEWLKAQKGAENVKVLVSGDPAAKRFAELAELKFELVDRSLEPMSGTAVRRAPWKYWDDIAPALRTHFTSTVALVGPEGAGKSTLASSLGRHFKTSVAHEYMPDWLRGTGNTMPTREQMGEEVWSGQGGSWRQARPNARRFFIADTDQLTIALWSRRLFGEPIRKEPMRPGFTLLCDDASPWMGPKDRDQPEARKQMVVEFRRLLTGRGWPFAFIEGRREQRFEQAVEHIEKWIRSNPLER
ncbi:MAG: AAA family ATPase [Archangium sp.]|nr:AAA family ATPase [Archangium sp.]